MIITDYIEETVKAYPEKFTGFYIPHLGDVDVAIREIQDLNRSVFKGIKLLPGWQGRAVNDRDLFPMYEAIQEQEMFLMVHTDHLTQSIDGDTPQKFHDMVLNFPELKIVAPHLGGLICLYTHCLPKYRDQLKNVTFIASVSATMEMVRSSLLR